jgi:hypothetical protein
LEPPKTLAFIVRFALVQVLNGVKEYVLNQAGRIDTQFKARVKLKLPKLELKQGPVPFP